MPLIAIPNVSTAVAASVRGLTATVEEAHSRVLDVHVDEEHGRSVLTCTGPTDALVTAMTALAVAARDHIDLTQHSGEHPRVGALDVCPFVPHEVPMQDAVEAARTAAAKIGAAGIPVLLYGEASDPFRALPEIRAGGLTALTHRVPGGLEPDAGPQTVDPSTGVVCVGARDVLVAFNVWIDQGIDVARDIAARLRNSHVRALGLDVSSHGRSQVSMNLVSPGKTGIDDVFERIEKLAMERGAAPVATEIVGLVPERFLPSADAKAARLLVEPGRSLESALRA